MTKSFADIFEQSGTGNSNIKEGATVKGTIVSIEKDYVAVDINFKSYGIIPREQFCDFEGNLKHEVGDKVDVYIVSLENDDSQIVLSHERAVQKKVWDDVERTFDEGGTVSGKVVLKVKGGLQVDIGVPAFLPGSQIDLRPHRDLDKFLGQEFECKVLKMTKDKGNIVISRRAVLVSEREELREETLKVISEGVVMEGTVKNVTDYGAFVDLGGLDGLLHVTDISWGRINHPSEKLEMGQKVPVVVLKYEKEHERVSLGMKQLTEDPWLKVEQTYGLNNILKGKVVSIVETGAYIELEEGIEGFVDINDISWTKKFNHANQYFKIGNEIEAVVRDFDHDNRRIDLSIKHLTPSPWETLPDKYPVGTKIKGKIQSITKYGVFVEVEEGIDGRVHYNDFSWTRKFSDPKDIEELYKAGDEIETTVLEIDPENERLSLGVKQLEENPWRAIAQRYPTGTKVKGVIKEFKSFGIVVEIEPELYGLIHQSELDLEKGQKIEEVYKVSEEVEAEITRVDIEAQRIALSVKAVIGQGRNDIGLQDDSPVTLGDIFSESLKNK